MPDSAPVRRPILALGERVHYFGLCGGVEKAVGSKVSEGHLVPGSQREDVLSMPGISESVAQHHRNFPRFQRH